MKTNFLKQGKLTILSFLFLSFFLLLLTVPNVSAGTFDIFKTSEDISYDSSKAKYTVIDYNLLTPDKKVIEMTRVTEQLVHVTPGFNVTVAEMFIENYKDKNKFFKGMELIDMKTGQEYSKKSYRLEQRSVVGYKFIPNLIDVCEERYEEDLGDYNYCYQVENGTKEIELYDWEEINLNKKLEIGNYTFRIVLDEVKPNEHGDWIMTLDSESKTDGFRLDKFAEWTSDLRIGLVSYYTLNNTFRGFYNDSLARYNGSVHLGSPTFRTTGKIGGSLYFDGNDCASLGDMNELEGGDELTINFWTNATNPAGNRDFMRKAISSSIGDYNIALLGRSGSYFDFFIYTDGLTSFSSSAFLNGTWKMVTATYNGSHMVIYINGVKDTSTPKTGNLINLAGTMSLGCRQPNDDVFMIGGIDELSYHNRSLTPAEISYIYDNGLGSTYSSGGSADSTPPYFTYIPPNATINYNQALNVDFNATDETGFGTFKVNDTTNFQINSSGGLTNKKNLTAGIYNLNITINDTSENINFTIWKVTVNQATTTPLITITPSNNETYGTAINVTGYNCTSQVSCSLYKGSTLINNGESIVYPAGTLIFTYNTTGNENHTSGTISKSITTNKAIPEGSISGTASITYGTLADITGTESNTGDADVLYKLYRDGIEVSNPDTSNLSAGIYNYVWNATEGQNITINSSMDTFQLTVNQKSSVVYTYLNHSRSNLTIVNGTSIWLNASRISGEGNIKLYLNGTLINSGTIIGNLTAFPTYGLYNVTAIYDATTNYTFGSETWFLNVTSPPPDLIPPIWVDLRNFTVNTNEVFSNSITATDISGISGYWLNDTTDFSIAYSTGLITNVSNLNSTATYNLMIFSNDTYGNTVNGTFYIEVVTAAVTGLTAADMHLGYNIEGFVEEYMLGYGQ